MLAIEDNNILEDVPVAGIDFLRELLQLIAENPGISCAGILENWRGSRYESRLNQLASSNNDLLSTSTRLEAEFVDAIKKLQAKKSQQKLKQLTNIRRVSNLSEEDKEAIRNLAKIGHKK